jgi:hypothetical protein
MQDCGNDWLLSPLPEPEIGRYYLECAWCHSRNEYLNWKCTSPAMFVDVNDPEIYPFPPYECNKCRDAKGIRLSQRGILYSEYLRSDHWQGIRALALRRAGNKCQMCSSRDFLQVHHNNYLRLWCEWPEDVIVLCDNCHEKHHKWRIKANASC